MNMRLPNGRQIGENPPYSTEDNHHLTCVRTLTSKAWHAMEEAMLHAECIQSLELRAEANLLLEAAE